MLLTQKGTSQDQLCVGFHLIPMTVITGVREPDTHRETLEWNNRTSFTDEICTKSNIYRALKINACTASHFGASKRKHTCAASTLALCIWRRQGSLWVNAGPGGEGSAAAYVPQPTQLGCQCWDLIPHFALNIVSRPFMCSFASGPLNDTHCTARRIRGIWPDLSCTGVFLNMRWGLC